MINLMAQKRPLKIGVLVVALVLVTAAAALGYQKWSSRLPDDAVFRYGDRVVTQDELDQRVEILGALYGVQRPDGDKGDEFDRDAAKSMAVSLILDDAAEDHDIVISDHAAQTQLDNLVDDQLVGGRPAFVDWLKEVGISEQDVLDEIKRQMATSRLVEETVGDVPAVTEDDVRAAYEEHKDRMATPEARHLLNIVVETKAEAQRVARLARAGRDFADLAATWSRDGSTRQSGGDLGFVTADQLESAFRQAAFGTRQGQVFGPVETRYGWNVGKVVAVQASQPLSLAKVHDELKAELVNRARLEVWRDHLGQLLEDADVEYADDYRPEDPTAPPADLTSSESPAN
ncbi:MAG TPA: peptidyl-prolyl cis-trans isomerase [Nocardioides sp.]|nr:peptidyl-prolyl cis-trans isomerase [Nocardioides sp.]